MWMPGRNSLPGATTINPKMNGPNRKQPSQGKAGGKLQKAERSEYKDIVSEILSPALNLRTMGIEINGQPLTEEAFEAMHLTLERDHLVSLRKADLQATIRQVAREQEFDPVAVWLNTLATAPETALNDDEWNGLAAQVLGLEGEFEREVLQKWLIACVARALDPGCKVDYALILHGRQGLKKSTFFADIAGKEFFTDSMDDPDKGKDELQKLHRSWVCEWAEADSVFTGAQKAEKLKRFVSACSDDFRAPYGRTVQRWLRRSVLVGTTNRDDWANDHTGARRYPVLSPKSIDNNWVRENRERIWSRAVAEYRRGGQWWFSGEQEEQITERARAYAPEDPWEVPLQRFWEGKEGEWFTTKELATLALGMDPDQVERRTLHQIRRSMERTFAIRLVVERRPHYPREARLGLKGLHSCLSVQIAS